MAGYTVYRGLDKGIKWLSDVNVILALMLAAYCFFCGPTVQLFNIFTNAFGKWLGNYPNMVFWTDPWGGGSFPQDWTIFYALFWAGFGPFMGLFIARISRGRTVREIILWDMTGTVSGGCLMHGIFGSYSLYVQHAGILDAVSILKTEGGAAAMVAVLGTLPFKELVLVAYCLLSTIFLATTVNSGSYVVASTATRRLSPDSEPHRLHPYLLVPRAVRSGSGHDLHGRPRCCQDVRQLLRRAYGIALVAADLLLAQDHPHRRSFGAAQV